MENTHISLHLCFFFSQFPRYFMIIYNNYDDEPEDIFQPLPQSRYSEFYEMEMGEFREDLPFFARHLPDHGSILELGCGTGRVGKILARQERQWTGIDISLPMLEKAASHGSPFCRYVGMDMTQLAFLRFFSAITIPYNTLNLLIEPGSAPACLGGCHALLEDQGVLLIHIFVPQHELLALRGNKSFQFQMFENPAGGKVIKEILRSYDPQTEMIHIEERYRVRYGRKDRRNEDFNHGMNLLAWPAERWCAIVSATGFSIEQRYGGYDFAPYSTGMSSCLLLAARRL